MDCPFKVGDKVRHKGSGETAVVTRIQTKCYKHKIQEHIIDGIRQTLNKPPRYGPCEFKYTGYVYVEYSIQGYSRKVKKVRADHFESVKELKKGKK